MSTSTFMIFAPGAIEIADPDGAIDGGERFYIKSDWSQAADATRLEITDGGGESAFAGDDAADELGSDGDQVGTATEADGHVVTGSVYIESGFEALAPDGSTVTFYLIEIEGEPVGYMTDAPIQPGVTFEAGPVFDVDSFNAPDYADLVSANYDSDNADLIAGGEYGDVIEGGAGDDTILTGEGDDTVWGNAGNDSIDLGAGDDYFGSVSDDDGNDTVDGGAGNDHFYGGDGDDLLRGGDGNDTLLGGRDNDTLEGGDGDDYFSIVDPHDNTTIDGGDGYDSVRFWNHLSTDDGVDLTFDGNGSGAFTFVEQPSTGQFTNIEQADGTALNDTLNASVTTEGVNLRGHGGDDLITGGSGADTLRAGSGNDTVTGGGGDDLFVHRDSYGSVTIHGGDGWDQLRLEGWGSVEDGASVTVTGMGDGTFTYGETSSSGSFTSIRNVLGSVVNDTIDASASFENHYIRGNSGNDSIVGGAGRETLEGDDGDDTIIGGTGDDLILGRADDDVLSGGEGMDTLQGGEGNDVLRGGAGADSLYGDDDADTFLVETNGLGDTLVGGEGGVDDDLVDLSALDGPVTVTYTNNEEGQITDSTGTTSFFEIEGIVLTDWADVADGWSTADSLFGGGGDDVLRGREGDDSLVGGEGDDYLVGDGGADTLEGESGSDTLTSWGGAASLAGGDDADTFFLYNAASGVGAGFDGATVGGGEGGFDEDVLDLSGSMGPLTITLTGDETGTVTDGTDTFTFTGIERIVLGDAEDIVDFQSWGGATIESGAGDDSVYGGSGNDSIFGGDGGDDLRGRGGDDTISGGLGRDTIRGNDGNNLLIGGSTQDVFYSSGVDTILAGDGDDIVVMHETAQNSVVDGEAGDEDYVVVLRSTTTDSVTFTFDGDNSGELVFSATGGTTTFSNIERVEGSQFGDVIDASADSTGLRILGHEGDDSLVGGSGADTIEGGVGDDTLVGGAGDDYLDGGDGADSIDAGAGDDKVHAGPGNDTVRGGDGRDELHGDAGDDVLNGDRDDDTLWGGDGHDTLRGGEGADFIDAGDGDDFVDGGSEDDVISGGYGNDTITGGDGADDLDGRQGNDLITGGVGDDTLRGDRGNDSLDGGDGNDSLAGGLDDDTVVGGQGADTLNGGGGADSLVGGDGDDSIEASSGADTVSAGGGDDVVKGGSDDDVISGGAGADRIQGDDGNDEIDGDDGNDTLRGGTGDDTLDGGEGQDTLSGEAGDDWITTGAGADTVIFTAGGGADTITDFDMGDNDGDGVFNDQLDVSELRTPDGQPINAWDVTVSDDGAGNALLSFPSGESVVLQGVAPSQISSASQMNAAGVPCFTAGTLVDTPFGVRPVEELRPGDWVHTADNGPQKVTWCATQVVTASMLRARPELRPVRIGAGALGNDRDMLVSPQHGIAILDEAGRDVFARAIHLARHSDLDIHVTSGPGPITYVHLMFDRHQVLITQKLLSESFYPGPWALRGLDPGDRERLLAIYPGLDGDAPEDAYGPVARPFLEPKDVRRLQGLACVSNTVSYATAGE